MLDEILSHHTGQPKEKVRLDTERDRFMPGDEAKEYGLIDSVITSRDEAKSLNLKKREKETTK